MTAVLTNDDLLRFRVDGGHIGAMDGTVGALLFDGTYYVTTPNQAFIPEPPVGNRKVVMRADSLYADDDPILWPQPYNVFNCHHGAIPTRKSLSAHSIIWWEPTHSDFIPLRNPTSPIRGLGKLSDSKLGDLKFSVSILLTRVQVYISGSSKARAPPTLGPMVKMIEHGLVRLESVWTNFRQMAFGVRDVQRCWLDVMAMLDYMEVYKPRMDSARLAVGSPPAEVADTVGVFTNDIRVAQDFFHAGLPFWLTRPASDLGQTNILAVVPISVPRHCGICFESHRFNYPIIYQGPASATQKHEAIVQYARNFLRYPDPFGLQTSDTNTSAPAHAETSGRPQASEDRAGTSAIVGDRLQCGASKGGDRKGGDRKGRKGKGVVYNKQKSSNPPTGRDKFDMYESPLMPLPIPVWRDALKAVKRDEAPASYHTRYLFPEAAIFASTNEVRRAKFFATWNVFRPACIFRVFSAESLATPLAGQQWRDFLLDGLTSLSRESNLVRRREEVKAIFAGTLDELQIDLHVPPSSHFPTVPVDEAQRILWELTELNFRFELLALDNRASSSSSHRDEDERQAMVLKCFDVPSLVVADVQRANFGLQAHDWRERLPFLLALRALMRDWDGLKPTPILLPDLASHDMYTELDVYQLEDCIARFYSQTFYHLFGRAAVVPARLP